MRVPLPTPLASRALAVRRVHSSSSEYVSVSSPATSAQWSARSRVMTPSSSGNVVGPAMPLLGLRDGNTRMALGATALWHLVPSVVVPALASPDAHAVLVLR